MALKSDGTLWAWGRNGFGQLGDGTTVDKLTPTQESTWATDWTAINAGAHHTMSLKSDGTLWAWGDNRNGQLGDDTTTKRTTPTQIGSTTDWIAIAPAIYHTVALKSDGTTVPGTPTNISAIAGNRQVSVTWNAPSSTGGSSITAYTVTASPGGQTSTWSSGNLTATVTGLTNGTSYSFTVTATNAKGNSPASLASNAVTPAPSTTAPALQHPPDGL